MYTNNIYSYKQAQKEKANKFIKAFGLTIEREYSEVYGSRGYSFKVVDKKGKEAIVIFNSRDDWFEGNVSRTGRIWHDNLFLYSTMSEMDAIFDTFKNEDIPVYICETNRDVNHFVWAKAEEFDEATIRSDGRLCRELKNPNLYIRRMKNV